MRKLAKGLAVAVVICALVALAGVTVAQHHAIDRLEADGVLLGDDIAASSDGLDEMKASLETLSMSQRLARSAIDRLDTRVSSDLSSDDRDDRDDREVVDDTGDRLGVAENDIRRIGDDLERAISAVNDLTAAVQGLRSYQAQLDDCLAWALSELERIEAGRDRTYFPPASCNEIERR